MRGLTLSIAALVGVIMTATPARAACTDPAGPAGKIIYNGDHSVLQYCDDTDWIAFPKDTGPLSWATPSQQRTIPADPAANDAYGTHVSIKGSTAIVGASGKNGARGAAYILTKTGDTWAQAAKLLPGDPMVNAGFGRSVSVIDGFAFAGAMEDSIGNGSTYVFTGSGTSWTQTQKLVAADAQLNDHFGQNIHADGDTLAIAAPTDDDMGADSGSVYIFTESGGTWTQTQKLTAADGQAGDTFGQAVHVDGDTLFVGAYADDDIASNAGAVYIYTRSGGVWTQTQKIYGGDLGGGDFFGHSVSVSGDFAIIGSASDDNAGGVDAGAAYIFQRSAGTWSQIAKLTAADAAASDLFGYYVDIVGNTMVVTSYNDDDGASNAGAVHMYKYDGSSWAHHAKINATDPTASSNFGRAAGIAGSTIVVGAHGKNIVGSASGAAYFLTPGPGSSVHYNWDTPALRATPLNPDSTEDDYFGSYVAVSGKITVIGAYYDDPGGISDAGSAYVFDSDTGNLITTLNNPDPTADDDFGAPVAVSGRLAVVGAYNDDPGGVSNAGTAYVFDAMTGNLVSTLNNPAPAADDDFGNSVAISGNIAVVGAYRDNPGGVNNAGTAYVFDATTGNLIHTLNNPAPTANDQFGYSVAVSGNIAVIGANMEDPGGTTDAGIAYVFDVTTGSLIATLNNPSASAYDLFGYSVAVSGNVAVVGAYLDDPGGVSAAGRAFVFDATTGNLITYLLNPDPTASDNFGYSVAVSGSIAIVGAYNDDPGGVSNSGSAYVFDAMTGALLSSLINPAPTAEDLFGYSVAVSGNVAVVGAFYDSPGGIANSGSAYIFASPWNCTGPTRDPGSIIYNEDDRVLQWCAGEEWQAAGPVGPVTAQSGCSDPAGTAGSIVYNEDHNVMQYCDGADWIGIGK